METSKIIRNALKIAFPLVLGGLILWWMYRDFDWTGLWAALEGGMDWTWMWLSMPFGVLAQVLRAVRWRQALEPLGERPRLATCVHAIFLSYASSLVVPRVGAWLYRRSEHSAAAWSVYRLVVIAAPVVLLLLATMSLVGDSYNPFLYWQF